ncbi:MAG: hypothetical protein IKI30_01120 [Oxalobacter sp.]|nr:hypothetical protein [Oxalobacter sp.]
MSIDMFQVNRKEDFEEADEGKLFCLSVVEGRAFARLPCCCHESTWRQYKAKKTVWKDVPSCQNTALQFEFCHNGKPEPSIDSRWHHGNSENKTDWRRN